MVALQWSSDADKPRSVRGRHAVRVVRSGRLMLRVEAPTLRLLRSDRQGLLLVVKATVASATAFEIARTAGGSHVPALAALAAIITVQVSGSQTARRAVEYSSGVAAGVIAAILLSRFLGVHWWSISLLTLLSLLAGRLIRLGSQANQIAISAVLVMSLGSSYGWTRIVDTLIGAAIGVATSLAVPQPSGHRAVRSQVAAAASELALALRGMSGAVGQGFSPTAVRDSLSSARNVSRQLADVRRWVETERDERRVSLGGRRTSGDRALDRCDAALAALDHVSNEVRSIGRFLLAMATETATVSEPDRAALGDQLELVAAAIDAWGRAVSEEDPAPHLARLHAASERTKAKLASIADLSRSGAPDPQWVAVQLEIERIAGELDPAGAHGAAIAPPTTAESPADRS